MAKTIKSNDLIDLLSVVESVHGKEEFISPRYLAALVKKVKKIKDTYQDVIDRDELFAVTQAIQFRNFELMTKVCNDRGFEDFRRVYDKKTAEMWPLNSIESAHETLDRFSYTKTESIYRIFHCDEGQHLHFKKKSA